jgi:hypothetical protein
VKAAIHDRRRQGKKATANTDGRHHHGATTGPIHRHAALCQEVMVHQHWVQHCR